jgi:ubiquinone/menaquinone biosynthesis C-methylase UbiE
MQHESEVKKVFDLPNYLINSADRIIVRTEIIADLIGSIEGKKILDLGCGDGSLSINYIAKNNITYVDFSKTMLSLANAKIPEEYLSNAIFIEESITNLKLNDKFDYIICIGLVAHVDNVDLLFEKIFSYLPPGGRLIVETTPNPFPLGKFFFPYYKLRNKLRKINFEYKKNRINIFELNAKLKEGGLTMQIHKTFSIHLPSFSHWSPAVKLWFTRKTLTNRFLSQFGSEHILMYIKSK